MNHSFQTRLQRMLLALTLALAAGLYWLTERLPQSMVNTSIHTGG